MKASNTNIDSKVITNMAPVFPALTDEDIAALDTFRQRILDEVEAAAVELVDKLSNTYANMDIDYLVACVDDAIEEFTYETMVDEEIEEDDDYPNCSY